MHSHETNMRRAHQVAAILDRAAARLAAAIAYPALGGNRAERRREQAAVEAAYERASRRRYVAEGHLLSRCLTHRAECEVRAAVYAEGPGMLALRALHERDLEDSIETGLAAS